MVAQATARKVFTSALLAATFSVCAGRNPRGRHLGEITPNEGGRPSSRALQ